MFSPNFSQMDWWISWDESSLNAYKEVFRALCLIPISHYVIAFTVIWVVFLYNFLEFHFFQDFFSGFRGVPVALTFHPTSHIYHGVVSKCKILHGRYPFSSFFEFTHKFVFLSLSIMIISLGGGGGVWIGKLLQVFSNTMVIKSSFSDCFSQFLRESSCFQLPQVLKFFFSL